MKTLFSICVGLISLAAPVLAQTPNKPATGLNLATVATPSSSYVSGDTLNEALNDGHVGRSSRDRRRGSYGNCPRRDTQWVQYDWTQPISTKQIEVYWWDDRQGVRLPKASRLRSRMAICRRLTRWLIETAGQRVGIRRNGTTTKATWRAISSNRQVPP